MRRFYDLACEHFGDDTPGLERVRRFFLWHLKFWHRYRPYTEREWRDAGHPLIQMREPAVVGVADELLLASAEENAHEAILQRVIARDYPGDASGAPLPARSAAGSGGATC
jgi:hypothetical protein